MKISKWWIYWATLMVVAICYVLFSIKYKDSATCIIIIQTGGILLTLVAMFLIMLQTIYESNRSAADQIKVISEGTNAQIEHFQKLTNQHIDTIQKESERQIMAYQAESEKQINNIQDSTKKQISAFISQTNEIVNRLEDVAEQLLKISDINYELLKSEQELNQLEQIKWQKRTEELQKYSTERMSAINRIKPNLYFMLETGDYLIFFTHLYFDLYNNGGDAKAITLNINFRNSHNNVSLMISKTFNHLNSLQRERVRLGRAKNFDTYNQVFVEILIKDIEQREYYAYYCYDKTLSTWFTIGLDERNKLLS